MTKEYSFCPGLPALKDANCIRCNNTGWVLPCNEKLIVMSVSNFIAEQPCYDNIKESEEMIKCNCGR